ncbi:cell division protein PerM [Nocardia cyriacigeorgica]|uniref:cell division protein PerM n=1 Tax=Nocardia cyriacigeorgica TaxID=135487 RepID=UPI0024920369|nr:DUF6350 family protein [Nocardia cyriacigeorgica]BDU08582.1 hypothetical protein FMUBM48_48450 [Nocardia cyriacigeorgica]
MSSPRNSLVRRTAPVRSEPEPPVDEPGFLSLTPERARVLMLVAARPAAFGLAAIVIAMFATLLASGSGLSGISGAIAGSWLAVHQVPVVIGATTLGVLPLLPTALLMWACGRECAHAVEPDPSRADLAWLVAAAVGGPLLVTAVCLAVTEDASGVLPMQPPNPLTAFAWVGGLHLVAAGCGIAAGLWPASVDRLPYWVVAAGYAAAHTVLRLLGAAAVVTVVSLLAHWSRIGDSYSGAGNAGGVIGLTVLSLLYLPNVVIGAVAVLVGAGVEFGDASVGVFSVVGGPVPAMPVLAALPTGPAAGWWPALLLIPVIVGVIGGLDTARTSHDRLLAPWSTLTSAALATVVLVLLGVVAGGELGTFGRIGPDLLTFAVVTVVLLAVTGYAGLVFARLFITPVGSPIPGFGYDDHGYDDHDYSDHDEYDVEDYLDEEYDDYDDDEFDDYDDGPELTVELDAEVIDEQPALDRRPARPADPPAEIVDAEVVEADLPESSRTQDR